MAPMRPTLVKRAAGEVAVRAETPPPPTEEEALKKIALRSAPPWLVSATVHLTIMVVMGLIIFHDQGDLLVDLNLRYSEQLGEQLIDDSSDRSSLTPDDVEQEVVAVSNLDLVEDPFSRPDVTELSLDSAFAAADVPAPVVGSLFDGREAGSRTKLLGKFGGDETTEEAVRLGLAWVARQQQPDGSWSLMGPYTSGSLHEVKPAATAMALLAFLGHGNTHKKGDYAKNVKAGIQALLRMQDAEGYFREGLVPHDQQYAHAQCTIALCELCAMTNDSDLRDAAQKAVDACLAAQGKAGGWRYELGDESDLSVTGWMVMALQSAKVAGLKVGGEAFERTAAFLDSVTPDGSVYAYQPQYRPVDAMMAEGLLCRQFLGWKQDDKRLLAGADTLLANHFPTWKERNVYYWYYGSQFMHHLEGERWERWNNAMKPLLVKHQEREGSQKGSWDPGGEGFEDGDRWGYAGGRLYVTCLSIYILEVYYRHMPLYKVRPKEAEQPAPQ